MAPGTMTLQELGVRREVARRGPGRVNLIKSMKAAADAVTSVACLAICDVCGDQDDWPTQLQYAEFWNMTERQAQRDYKRVREVFGPEADINELAREMVRRYRDQLSRQDAAFAASVPADGLFAALFPLNA